MYCDADCIEALEYSLPPTAGVGIDRLAMPFADVAFIAQASLLPHLRPQRPAPANGPPRPAGLTASP